MIFFIYKNTIPLYVLPKQRYTHPRTHSRGGGEAFLRSKNLWSQGEPRRHMTAQAGKMNSTNICAPPHSYDYDRAENLPGMGGVYNYMNLHVCHYAGNNPVKYVDPDGREATLKIIIEPSESE
jgi:hypothetical protein